MERRAAVWRWQLMLALSTALVAVLVAGFRPDFFAQGSFALGMAAITAITLVAFAVPWRRVPKWAIALIPFADILAIGLTTMAADIRLGFLWVFPVTWIASYYSMPVIVGSIALVSGCLVVFSESDGDASDMLLRVLVTVLSLGFLGTTIRISTQRSRAARRLLRRQSEQLNRVALRAETHERRVTQIIDSLDLALVAVAEDGTLVKMNDAYRDLYRRDLLDDNLPSRAVEYDDRRGDPLPPDSTSLARATRGDVMDCERMWLFDTEGQWRALQVSSQDIATVRGRSRTTLLMIEDVSAALEAANERQAMTAIVSHELRNPLTAIIGHVDLLRERDDLPERVQEQLEIIGNASERIERLVVSALDETRPEGVLSEPVNLRQLVDASVASFLPTAQSQRLQLEVEGIETLMLYGDAFRLRQVIDNLVSNAVKYTPAGGRVAVSVGVADSGDAEVYVTDTGMGMSAADIDLVFEPYFRAERAAVSDIPGTGLGMGVVRDIIAMHNGTIDIVSEVGVGTSVTMRFPRQRAEKETA